MPSVLFQGSVLLGTLAKTFVGSAAMAKSQVMVHPNLIAGWCSLVCTALNALPVGSLDGGRIVQAAYGEDVATRFYDQTAKKVDPTPLTSYLDQEL